MCPFISLVLCERKEHNCSPFSFIILHFIFPGSEIPEIVTPIEYNSNLRWILWLWTFLISWCLAHSWKKCGKKFPPIFYSPWNSKLGKWWTEEKRGVEAGREVFGLSAHWRVVEGIWLHCNSSDNPPLFSLATNLPLNKPNLFWFWRKSVLPTEAIAWMFTQTRLCASESRSGVQDRWH